MFLIEYSRYVCIIVLRDYNDDCLHTYNTEIDFGLIVFCMFHMDMSKDIVVVVAAVVVVSMVLHRYPPTRTRLTIRLTKSSIRLTNPSHCLRK